MSTLGAGWLVCILRQKYGVDAEKEASKKLRAARAVSSGIVCFEALAHASFFTTGHRGKVAGTVKLVLDGLDLVAHGLHGTVVPLSQVVLGCLHTGLFAWHLAKKVDSELIATYSPLRALFWPNAIDTATYCSSAVLALRDADQQRYAIAGAGIYAVMRCFDYIY